MLAPLGDYGGRAQTHALLAGSPAIDGGDNAFAKGPGPDGIPFNGDDVVLTRDQRNLPFERTVDGGSGTATVDMGSFESQALAGLSLVVTTANDELDPVPPVGADLSVREALSLANGSAGADTITFDTSLSGSIIELTLGELKITDPVTITGLGADQLSINAQDDSRIFQIDDGNAAQQLDVQITGLTLTNGHATDGDDGVDSDADRGGAIFSRENLVLDNSVVSGNTAAGTGGGIYSNLGDLAVTDSVVSGNSTTYYGPGGGIGNVQGTLTVTSSHFSGNSATGYGGGVFSDDGDVRVTSSTISGNSSDYHGGGIYGNTGAVTVTDSTIARNLTADDGGGIHSGSGPVTVTNSTISGNVSYNEGGGIYSLDAAVTLTNSTVTANESYETGGGIGFLASDDGESLTIRNSIVAGNEDSNEDGPDFLAPADPATNLTVTNSDW